MNKDNVHTLSHGPTPEEARAAFAALQADLNAAVPEREVLIELLLDALIAGEHVFVLGEPGTAKSYVLELLAKAFQLGDGDYFETLVTRHSEPGEFLGPMSLKGLENDEYRRVTEGMLPEATLAFLDEVFKGNSAVLNGLLKIINERRFRNGGVTVDVPLRMVMSASNEVPDLSAKKGDSLAAFYDRFLVRVFVEYLEDDDTFDRMCADELPGVTATVSFQAVDALAAAAHGLPLTPDVKDAIRAIRSAFAGAGVAVSDRRWKAIIKLLRARAARLGRSQVTQDLLPAVMHCAWSKPEQRPTVEEIVTSNMATWLQEVREANAALDEMAKKIETAKKAVDLAEITDEIVSLKGDLARLATDYPDAAGEIDDVLMRAGVVSNKNLAKMAELAGA